MLHRPFRRFNYQSSTAFADLACRFAILKVERRARWTRCANSMTAGNGLNLALLIISMLELLMLKI